MPAPPADARPGVSSIVKRYVWLIALGLGAALLFAVATLPASLLEGTLEKRGVQAASLQGSVWSGTARGLSWRGAVIGDLSWQLSPFAVLLARAAGHAVLERADGRVETDFELRPSGRFTLREAKLAMPVAAFDTLPLGMPSGWQGQASARIEELVLEQGWPNVLRGELDMDQLVAPPPRSTGIGSYHVVFPDPGFTASDATLSAGVSDKEGPFSVSGRLTVSRDRSFLLEGTLAPRGEVPPAMERSLALLGPADENGRRPFSVSGTL
jgi:general secretion pathway protein N